MLVEFADQNYGMGKRDHEPVITIRASELENGALDVVRVDVVRDDGCIGRFWVSASITNIGQPRLHSVGHRGERDSRVHVSASWQDIRVGAVNVG